MLRNLDNYGIMAQMDIVIRNAPKELVLRIKHSAVDCGMSVKEWVLKSCGESLNGLGSIEVGARTLPEPKKNGRTENEEERMFDLCLYCREPLKDNGKGRGVCSTETCAKNGETYPQMRGKYYPVVL